MPPLAVRLQQKLRFKLSPKQRVSLALLNESKERTMAPKPLAVPTAASAAPAQLSAQRCWRNGFLLYGAPVKLDQSYWQPQLQLITSDVAIELRASIFWARLMRGTGIHRQHSSFTCC